MASRTQASEAPPCPAHARGEQATSAGLPALHDAPQEPEALIALLLEQIRRADEELPLPDIEALQTSVSEQWWDTHPEWHAAQILLRATAARASGNPLGSLHMLDAFSTQGSDALLATEFDLLRARNLYSLGRVEEAETALRRLLNPERATSERMCGTQGGREAALHMLDVRARALQIRGVIALHRNALAESEAHLQEAAAIHRVQGDRVRLAECMRLGASVRLRAERFRDARIEAQEARRHFLELNNRAGAARVNLLLALIHLHLGEHNDAEGALDTAGSHFSLDAMPARAATVELYRAVLAHDRGALDEADAALDRLHLPMRSASRRGSAFAQGHRGLVALERGRIAEGARDLEEASASLLQMGDAESAALFAAFLGRRLVSGDPDAGTCASDAPPAPSLARRVRERLRRRPNEADTTSSRQLYLRLADRLRNAGWRGESGRSGPESPGSLLISPDGRWCRLPDGRELHLGRRIALHRILAALARRHIEEPGHGIPVEELVSVGWPDQALVHESGRNRLYAAIRTLRQLAGSPDWLENQPGRYRIRPTQRVQLALPPALRGAMEVHP